MYYRPHIDISIHCVWALRLSRKRRKNLKTLAYLKYRMVFDRIWTAFRFDNGRQLPLFRFQLWLVHYHLLGHRQLPCKTKDKTCKHSNHKSSLKILKSREFNISRKNQLFLSKPPAQWLYNFKTMHLHTFYVCTYFLQGSHMNADRE